MTGCRASARPTRNFTALGFGSSTTPPLRNGLVGIFNCLEGGEQVENNYCIYAHISPSNKAYIGITCQKPNRRWHGGSGYREQPKFYNAIKKYGWDNFKHIILFENLTESQACELETKLIEQYDSIKNGYNQTNGGTIGYHYKHSEETKLLLSKLRKGVPLNPEHKLKSIAQLAKNREKRQREVYCIETRETFKSIKEAANAYNLRAEHICECCKGKRKTCGKLHWIYVGGNHGEVGRSWVNQTTMV